MRGSRMLNGGGCEVNGGYGGMASICDPGRASIEL